MASDLQRAAGRPAERTLVDACSPDWSVKRECMLNHLRTDMPCESQEEEGGEAMMRVVQSLG